MGGADGMTYRSLLIGAQPRFLSVHRGTKLGQRCELSSGHALFIRPLVKDNQS